MLDISGHTKLYCLIGNPVAHSLSPFIMNRAFVRHEIDGAFTAFPVMREHLAEALAGLKALGVVGANVTYPHKEAVLSFLDRPTDRSSILRASNTLWFDADGIHGDNTDAVGIVVALAEFGGISLIERKVLIFGAGGAGRAAAFGVLEAGAAGVSFFVRNPSRAERAIAPLRDFFSSQSITVVSTVEPDAHAQRKTSTSEADVLIQATPIGMVKADGDPAAQSRVAGAQASRRSKAAGEQASGRSKAAGTQVSGNGEAAVAQASGKSEIEPVFPLLDDIEWIQPNHCCIDLVYHPRETAFLSAARERGAVCLDGLALLVAQARESFRIWTGEVFDLREMAKAVDAHTTAAVSPKGM